MKLILLASLCMLIIPCCSKDDSKKSDNDLDLPDYSIEIKRDGKLLFKGDICAMGGIYYPNGNKEGFVNEDLIVVPKYPDNPNSHIIETHKVFDDGTSFSACISLSTLYKPQKGTYSVIRGTTGYGAVKNNLYYLGGTNEEPWTHISGQHTIAKAFVYKKRKKDSDGKVHEVKYLLLNGNFEIKYSDKTGEHTIIGNYKNLIIYFSYPDL